MSGKSWGAGLSPGVSAHRRWGVPWIWDHQGQRLELKGEASPLSGCTLAGDAELELDSWRGEMGASRTPPPCCAQQLPQWEPAVSPIERVPNRAAVKAASLALLWGDNRHPQLTVATSSSPCTSTAPSPCLLSAPSSPHIPEPEELSLSGERPFPVASNFPRVGKEPRGSFLIPPHLRPPRCAQGWERAGSVQAQ